MSPAAALKINSDDPIEAYATVCGHTWTLWATRTRRVRYGASELLKSYYFQATFERDRWPRVLAGQFFGVPSSCVLQQFAFAFKAELAEGRLDVGRN